MRTNHIFSRLSLSGDYCYIVPCVWRSLNWLKFFFAGRLFGKPMREGSQVCSK